MCTCVRYSLQHVAPRTREETLSYGCVRGGCPLPFICASSRLTKPTMTNTHGNTTRSVPRLLCCPDLPPTVSSIFIFHPSFSRLTEYLHARPAPPQTLVPVSAMIQWAASQPASSSSSVVADDPLRPKRLEVLKWCRENGCPWDEATTSEVRKGCLPSGSVRKKRVLCAVLLGCRPLPLLFLFPTQDLPSGGVRKNRRVCSVFLFPRDCCCPLPLLLLFPTRSLYSPCVLPGGSFKFLWSSRAFLNWTRGSVGNLRYL